MSAQECFLLASLSCGAVTFGSMVLYGLTGTNQGREARDICLGACSTSFALSVAFFIVSLIIKSP